MLGVSADDGRALTGGSAPLVRRVRLPADRRTPAVARALVRAVLDEAALGELADEALLLTTELATNGVLHAGTALDLELVADRAGLTVTVTDFAPGVLTAESRPTADDAEPAERGRGLLLVDHFASRWGTVHQTDSKAVWFRLARPGHAAATGAEPAAPSAAALAALLDVRPGPPGEQPPAEYAAVLLGTLAEVTGAPGAVVQLDCGDGAGSRTLARYGAEPDPGEPEVAVPLPVSRPQVGQLRLAAAPSGPARPLARLVAERIALHIENDRLRRADRRRQSWLTFLAEASELLAQSLDPQLTMALIPQLVVPRLGSWCAVHTLDGWGRLQLTAAAHADEALLADVLAALKETGAESTGARLREAARLGTHLPLPPPLEGFAVPLVARGQRLGALAVGRPPERRHDLDEIAVLEDVAHRAALAVDNARIHDERRAVAHALQQSLLPPVLPVVPGIGFAAAYVPAGDAADVGGDFFDVVPLPHERWLVVVGDVSGKGVQAAAVTGLVRDVVRVLAQDGRPLDRTLARLNETLVERGGGRYCTLALAAVEPRADGRLGVSLHLAGHDRPLLVGADGRASFVGTGGTALGLLRRIESPPAAVTLAPGDSLVFYTDGVTERRRGQELFGTQRLRDAAAPLSGYSAEVVAARLRTATLGFSAEVPRDDIAILVVRNESTHTT
ncbi:MAG TPA: SpoIIE family protein phosphatase [Pilimelia sp.]|nr:SpoIIE family protein phosphatase [Pilimelia sp.]